MTFHNVPAFAIHLDVPVEVPSLGTVTVDIAWGGMMYVLVRRRQRRACSSRRTRGPNASASARWSRPPTREQKPVVHPENPGADRSDDRADHRPADPPGRPRQEHRGDLDRRRSIGHDPITWTGVLDRSACGTGTCARMAVLHARGQLGLGPGFRARGDPGHHLHRPPGRVRPGRPVPRRRPDDQRPGLDHRHRPVRARPDDPFPEGFTVGDIWGGIS